MLHATAKFEGPNSFHFLPHELFKPRDFRAYHSHRFFRIAVGGGQEIRSVSDDYSRSLAQPNFIKFSLFPERAELVPGRGAK
jgi:hypothetical protein